MPKEIKKEVWEQFKGSIYDYVIDMTLINQTLGTTVSSATWSTEDSNIVSIGTTSFATPDATSTITASNPGTAIIKLVLATTGNDAPIYYFEINVLDPESKC